MNACSKTQYADNEELHCKLAIWKRNSISVELRKGCALCRSRIIEMQCSSESREQRDHPLIRNEQRGYSRARSVGLV